MLASTSSAVRQDLTPKRLCLALAQAAVLLLSGPAAQADVSLTGPYWLNPWDPLPLGPGDINLPDAGLSVGAGAPGSFAVTAGSQFVLGRLAIAAAGSSATALLDGVGSRLVLTQGNLEVGHFGNGTMTVSGGASLDAMASAAVCAAQTYGCYSFIGSAADSTAAFTVSGAGSNASFAGRLKICGAHVNSNFGIPGAESHSTVQVLAGGLLNTSQVNMGHARASTDWEILHGGRVQIVATAGQNAGLDLGAGGSATLLLSDAGSSLDISGQHSRLVLADSNSNPGSFAELIVQHGARLTQTGEVNSYLNIAEAGRARLQILSGGQVSGARNVQVGSLNGYGELLVDGEGSRLALADLASSLTVAYQGQGQLKISGGARVDAGRLEMGRLPGSFASALVSGADSVLTLGAHDRDRLYLGNGELTVSNGGVIDGRQHAADCANDVWCATLVGANAGTNAKFTVTGAGSRASFLGHFQAGLTGLATPAADGWSEGVPGGATTTTVQVLDGGLLQADRFAAGLGTYSLGATGTESSLTRVLISGPGSVMQLTGGDSSVSFKAIVWNATNAVVNVNIADGGKLQLLDTAGLGASMSLSGRPGITNFNVSGAGSAVEFSSPAYAVLNLASSGGTAQMSFSAGAQLSGVTQLQVGSWGGQGKLSYDGADTAGHFASFAYLGVGRRDGQGVLSISNGASGAGISLGGITSMPGGTGVLTVSGGSELTVTAAAGLASASVGHSGAGVARFDGGSILDLGSGSLFIGRELGSVGVLTLAGGSNAKAGYVGVGSTLGANTGVATLIVNDSTLSAAIIEIGSQGYVGGNGNLQGHVINRGVFNPGNSPGRMTLGGDFTNQAGGRLLLEVAAKAAGGFDVDQLIFADTAAVDLSGLQISFSFLGATDPNDFQAAGGFQIDSFLQRSGGAGLADGLFQTVSFLASSSAYKFESFSFTADGGAVFVAQAVPEPSSRLLLLGGLVWIGSLARSRKGRQECSRPRSAWFIE